MVRVWPAVGIVRLPTMSSAASLRAVGAPMGEVPGPSVTTMEPRSGASASATAAAARRATRAMRAMRAKAGPLSARAALIASIQAALARLTGVVDVHRLDLGEELERGLPLLARADPRGLHAAEGHLRLAAGRAAV